MHLRSLVLAIGLAGLLPAWSAASAADAAAGKALAEGCAGCHGDDGVSRTPLTPSLAGEPDEYVQWQLVFFRSGARKSDVMGGIAEALTNDDIRNLGAYYASLPPPKPQQAEAPAADALAKEGAQLAAQHRCKSCHSEDFTGFRAAARLAGQREDVMLKALRDFKAGSRISNGVASMADVVFGLSDDDMRALAHYMAMRD